jgi:hypothetical protein
MLDLLIRIDMSTSIFWILHKHKIPYHPLLSKRFVQHCFTIIVTFKMLKVKDMTELVISVESYYGLQILILQDVIMPNVWFIHQFQLVLVRSSKKVEDDQSFFQTLNLIVNVVRSSCKCNDELQTAYETEIFRLV